MKVISLNTWSGRGGNKALLDFFRRHHDVDVFCLQEVWEGGEDYAPKWSTGIDANEFKVLPDEVSDHLAMYLNFE